MHLKDTVMGVEGTCSFNAHYSRIAFKALWF